MKAGYLHKQLVVSSSWMHSRMLSCRVPMIMPQPLCLRLRCTVSEVPGRVQWLWGQHIPNTDWFPLATETLNKPLHLLVTLRHITVSCHTNQAASERHRHPSWPSDLNPRERQNTSFLSHTPNGRRCRKVPRGFGKCWQQSKQTQNLWKYLLIEVRQT